MSELISEGLTLMLFGMGVVFVFITLLVIATSLMSRLLLVWFPPLKPELPPLENRHELAKIAAVVASAIQRYRSDHSGAEK